MTVASFRSLLIGLALIVAFWGGFALKPTKHIADTGPKVNLESMIPQDFADWKVDDQVVPIQVDPQRIAVLNRIYNQTLSRTYINAHGERVMLSIAYGGDQSDSMQVHKPEVCYPAQGFQMLDLVIGTFDTGYGVIPVKRMLAKMSNRLEPITYWITIGDTVALNNLRWKLAQLKYGLTGKVPDGMIFRVSSLGEKEAAYPVHEQFIRDLLKSLSPEVRTRLIGNTTL
ncbi:exosortase-associated protein EpsI, B-type [Methylotenera sp.]|uniref:exosortase-associated protein EpsI, B-type n=1 Tax=Methylotenera sp. TaxID=2051956 RepID=UPI00272FA180|nr:exosortase-associated protein EpsI, B-type [Methylotenera sp.]MDP2231501.1 EpsI family protein [Methylotenera sp.]